MALRAAPKTMGQPKWRSRIFCVGAGTHHLDALRRKIGTSAMAGDAEYPGKTEIGEDCRLDIVGEEPAKVNAPLDGVGFVDDLFRAGKLLVARQLVHGFAEAGGGESRETNGIELLCLRFRAKQEAYRRIRAGTADSLPQGEQLFCGHHDAGLVHQPRR